jgi:hypothetical protein
MYGCDQRLMAADIPQRIFSDLYKELEGQAMIFVEGFEMYVDTKSNKEKKQSLVRIP